MAGFLTANLKRPIFSRTTDTDLVRLVVIISLSVCCTLITALSFYHASGFSHYPLFFIPIVYAAYFYPKKGIYIAGICAVVFQAVGYYFRYPDSGAMLEVTAEAIFFVLTAAVIAYFIERIQEGELRYRSIFEHSQLGIVIFSRSTYTIVRSNARFYAMLHVTEGDLTSRDLLSLLYNERERERFLERIAKDAIAEDFETRFTTREGDACWVNLSWSAIDENTVSCTAININSRKLAEKANNDNMMKYRQLTEFSPLGVLIVQEGLIRTANPAFLAFLGFSVQDVMNRDLAGFVDPADRPAFTGFLERMKKGTRKAPAARLRFLHRDGASRTGGVFAIAVVHVGRPATMFLILDMSEKEMLEERIRLDNERRRGIIITVAHELRTPLQPILGYLNLLLSDPAGFGVTDDTKKILERCLASVDRERQIINQMLELSVLDSGKLQLSYSEFSPAILIESVLEAGGYATKAEISVDVSRDLMLRADRDRLYSVLDSLLSNAINYSRAPRKIAIAAAVSADGSQYLISVRDNGIGIPADALASIFEPFQLADAAKLSRKYDRIGLSLSIAKRVVEMHGGDIRVESTEHAGSTFTIQLPRGGTP